MFSWFGINEPDSSLSSKSANSGLDTRFSDKDDNSIKYQSSNSLKKTPAVEYQPDFLTAASASVGGALLGIVAAPITLTSEIVSQVADTDNVVVNAVTIPFSASMSFLSETSSFVGGYLATPVRALVQDVPPKPLIKADKRKTSPFGCNFESIDVDDILKNEDSVSPTAVDTALNSSNKKKQVRMKDSNRANMKMQVEQFTVDVLHCASLQQEADNDDILGSMHAIDCERYDTIEPIAIVLKATISGVVDDDSLGHSSRRESVDIGGARDCGGVFECQPVHELDHFLATDASGAVQEWCKAVASVETYADPGAKQETLETKAVAYAAREKLARVASRAELETLDMEASVRAQQERLERQEAEEAEQERLDREVAVRVEQERLKREATEQEMLERQVTERAEHERLERLAAAERAEHERLKRLAAERTEHERLEKLAAESAERERLERLAAERAEHERLERLAAERLAAERADQEMLERQATQGAEQVKCAKEAIVRTDQEKLEREAVIKAEQLRREQELIAGGKPVTVRLERDAIFRAEPERCEKEAAVIAENNKFEMETISRHEQEAAKYESIERQEAAEIVQLIPECDIATRAVPDKLEWETTAKAEHDTQSRKLAKVEQKTSEREAAANSKHETFQREDAVLTELETHSAARRADMAAEVEQQGIEGEWFADHRSKQPFKMTDIDTMQHDVKVAASSHETKTEQRGVVREVKITEKEMARQDRMERKRVELEAVERAQEERAEQEKRGRKAAVQSQQCKLGLKKLELEAAVRAKQVVLEREAASKIEREWIEKGTTEEFERVSVEHSPEEDKKTLSCELDVCHASGGDGAVGEESFVVVEFERFKVEQDFASETAGDSYHRDVEESAQQERICASFAGTDQHKRLKREAVATPENERLERDAVERVELERIEMEAAARAEQERCERAAVARMEQEKFEPKSALKFQRHKLELKKLEMEAAARARHVILEREAEVRAELDKVEQETVARAKLFELEAEKERMLQVEDKLENEVVGWPYGEATALTDKEDVLEIAVAYDTCAKATNMLLAQDRRVTKAELEDEAVENGTEQAGKTSNRAEREFLDQETSVRNEIQEVSINTRCPKKSTQTSALTSIDENSIECEAPTTEVNETGESSSPEISGVCITKTLEPSCFEREAYRKSRINQFDLGASAAIDKDQFGRQVVNSNEFVQGMDAVAVGVNVLSSSVEETQNIMQAAQVAFRTVERQQQEIPARVQQPLVELEGLKEGSTRSEQDIRVAERAVAVSVKSRDIKSTEQENFANVANAQQQAERNAVTRVEGVEMDAPAQEMLERKAVGASTELVRLDKEDCASDAMEGFEREVTTRAEYNRLEREAADKAEAERLEKEAVAMAEHEILEREVAARAEQARLKSEEERLAREGVDRDRLNREATARAEQDRLQREVVARRQERLERENAEQERQKRKAAARAEQERIERAAAARAEQHKLEREGTVRAEKERLQKEVAARKHERLEREFAARCGEVIEFAYVKDEKLGREAALNAEIEENGGFKLDTTGIEVERLDRELTVKTQQQERRVRRATILAEHERFTREAAARAEQDLLVVKVEQERLEQEQREAVARTERERQERIAVAKERLDKEAAARVDRLRLETAAKVEEEKREREAAAEICQRENDVCTVDQVQCRIAEQLHMQREAVELVLRREKQERRRRIAAFKAEKTRAQRETELEEAKLLREAALKAQQDKLYHESLLRAEEDRIHSEELHRRQRQHALKEERERVLQEKQEGLQQEIAEQLRLQREASIQALHSPKQSRFKGNLSKSDKPQGREYPGSPCKLEEALRRENVELVKREEQRQRISGLTKGSGFVFDRRHKT